MRNINKREIFFIAIIGLAFWVLDALAEKLVHNKSFFDVVFFNIPVIDLIARLLTTLVIVISGILIAIYSNKVNESMGRYRQLFDKMHDAIFITPATSSSDRANIIEVNAEATHRLGYSREELQKFALADLVPPENSAELLAMNQRLLVERHVLYETVQIAKDGGRNPVEINAHLVDLQGRPAIMSIARDIGKRKQVEGALKQSEALFRAIFQGAGIGMAMLDLDGRIIQVNTAAQTATGYSQEELSGKPFNELPSPDENTPDLELFRELASGRRDHYQVEKRYRCKQGRILWGGLTVSLVRDPEGLPRFAIGMVEDITARKNAEAALRQAHHELERRVEERTAALNQANLELKREVDERRSAEKALRNSQEQLQTLTSQFLTAQEAERRRISLELHDELGQAMMLLKFKLSSLADKPHKNRQVLRKDYDALLNYLDGIIENVRRLSRDLSPTILEELGLSSALRFLLEEVKKYSDIKNFSLESDEINGLFPPQTQINIYRIFQESLTNIVRHSGAQNISMVINKHDDYASFTIQDDGAGFDLDQVLAREVSQKGMGLAAMQERARIAGGSLDIQSQAGSGTRISFIIPTTPGGQAK